MYPFSYTGLKIIHDQKIQEALEHQQLDAEQKTQRRVLHQMFISLLVRSNRRAAQKQEEPIPDLSGKCKTRDVPGTRESIGTLLVTDKSKV